MASNERIAFIELKAATLKSHITNLTNLVKNSAISAVNANLRLTNLSRLFDDYGDYQEELSTLNPAHPLIENYFALEAEYYDIASKVTELQAPKTSPLANSTTNSQNITITERQALPSLPEIKLPSFDGDRKNWTHYKNKFISLVHARTDISDAVKCNQLFGSLTGRAASKIEHFDPSEADYSRAWKTLLDFYDHKRIVVNQHLDALIHLPKFTNATADNLSTLLDLARQHLHILDRLEARPSEELVVRLIEHCLPKATESRWQDKLEMDKLPKLDDLFQFLQANIFKLQAVEPSSGNASADNKGKKRPGDAISQTYGKNAKSAKTFVTNSTPSSTSTSSGNSSSTSNTPVICPCCKQDHRLFRCPTFKGLGAKKGYEFVKANNICTNCLWSHSTMSCPNEKRCKKCNKKHHTLLHFSEGSAPKPSSGPKDQPPNQS